MNTICEGEWPGAPYLNPGVVASVGSALVMAYVSKSKTVKAGFQGQFKFCNTTIFQPIKSS